MRRATMWKNIDINDNLVESQTERGIRIAMPHSSEFDGYSLWLPSKVVREGRNRASISIGINTDFRYSIKKYGNGKWNRFSVISENDISGDDVLEAFSVVDSNISTRKPKNEFETHKPIPMDAEERDALAELTDD